MFAFGHWNLSRLAFVFLWYTPIFANSTTYFLALLVAPDTFYIFSTPPSPRINYFFKEPWFLLLENGVRNQDLGIRYAHCSWDVIAFRSLRLPEQENLCAQVYTHFYKYFCIYLSVSVLS